MQSNLKQLTTQKIQASASGKTILIGEHSVVYGHKALAAGLPDIKLNISIEEGSSSELSWEDSWQTFIFNKPIVMEKKIKGLLFQAFQKALNLIQPHFLLNEYFPQKILIHSQIPLGGGMGGSAAMSTCFVRLASIITGVTLTFEQEIEYANEVDSLFHDGKASGLDVSAVASQGIIEFQRGVPVQKVNHKSHFWLALIDSQERSETALMIQKVRNKLEINPEEIKLIFEKLNELTITCRFSLEKGDLQSVGINLNEAHDCLVALGISTEKIKSIVHLLKQNGALGAKVTGAGGGGLVLGIFSQKPTFLFDIYSPESVYLSYTNPIKSL